MRAKFLPTIATTVLLPFLSTSTTEGQVKENPKPAAVKKADDLKATLPKLFEHYAINGKIDVIAALEFHIDKANVPHNYLLGYSTDPIPKEQIEKVVDWYIKVAALKSTKPEEKEVFLDIAATIHHYIKDKDSILKPLPKVVAEFDEDKNREIDTKEAFKLYEARTGIKLERKENGQVAPASFRKVIDEFQDVSTYKKNNFQVTGWYAQHIFRQMTQNLSREYERLYGPTPVNSDPETIIQRD